MVMHHGRVHPSRNDEDRMRLDLRRVLRVCHGCNENNASE